MPCSGRALHLIHQFVLGIALVGDQLVAQFLGQRRAALDDGVQRVGAVESRFPGAQQVQIGAIEQQQPRHIECRLAARLAGCLVNR